MRRLLLATTAFIAFAAVTPANAVLQITFRDTLTGTTQTIVDGGLGDFAGQTNNLITLNNDVGGFHIFGTASFSSAGNLSMSSFGILNQGATSTLQILVGNTGFASPVTGINESGALTYHNNVGAGPSSLQFYADTGNTQPSLAAPGTLLFTASGTPDAVDDSFSGTAFTPFSANSPFAMAEFASFNMLQGATITGFEQSMTTVAGAVPEPATWFMMILGFLGVGGLAMKRKGQLRLA
jgi:hypothetical protein